MQCGAQAKAIANVVKQQPHPDRSLPDAAVCNREKPRAAGTRGLAPRSGRGSLQTSYGSSSVEANRFRNGAMSEKNPIRLYVTHAFAGNADYHRVFEYLEALPNFFYRNCSVPDHLPSMPGREALK